MERDARRAALAAEVVNEFIGTPKERLFLNVTVRSIRTVESDWGVSTLYILVTDDNHLLKYFASRAQLGETADRSFRVKATIKDHQEWDGAKYTVITRAVVQVA